MKKAILVLLVLTTFFVSRAQQPIGPAVPPTAQTPPAGNGALPVPSQGQNNPIPGAMVTPTNPSGAIYPGINTNPPPATNPPPMQPTNALPQTNVATPGSGAALGLTNRLSTMSPAQAQSVIQVQVELNMLQQVAVNIQGVQNVQQVIQQNPQVHQQLQQVSGQIINLARGPSKPSFDSAERLSVDLLRACSRVRLGRDHQLVIAIIINEACNSQNLTMAQIDEAINNGLIVLRTAGVPAAFGNIIGCDLRSIAFEVQPSLGI